MTESNWQTIKVHYCQRVGHEVSLEAQVIFPSDVMPETPPRILAHRCSFGMECNLEGTPSCVWAGSNPEYDPFKE